MTEHSPRPWWRYGFVWLIIAGPLAVVVASLWTGWIAMRDQDPVLSTDYYRQGLDINKTLERQGAMAPALTARNHAVTPPTAPADQ